MKFIVSLESAVLIFKVCMQFLYRFKLAGFLGKTTERMKQYHRHEHTYMILTKFEMLFPIYYDETQRYLNFKESFPYKT